jgi:hypothetical protein
VADPELWPYVGIAAGYLMIRLGLRLNGLELRRRHRPCPSCGRAFRGTICPWCASGR